MLNYLEIKDCNNIFFEEFVEIYNDSFPANERNSLAKIIYRINNQLSKLYINIQDNHVIAFAFLAQLSNNFVLLDYFAVKKEFRNQGIGSKFIDFIIENINNQTLILEVENPYFGEDKFLKQKRIEFYQKKGIKILENIRYILPPYDNSDNFTEMVLMFYNKKQTDIQFDKQIIKNLISDIYSRIYERFGNDIYLKQILEFIK